MSFASWLKSLFHKVNAQHIAGALAASKQVLDQVGAIEKWAWLPKFDADVTEAITLLDSWKSGAPTSEIEAVLNDAMSIVNSASGLSANDKLLTAVFISSAESALELLG